MNKPILLTWHDFAATTGFANVAKNLLKGMHEHYQLHIVGINYHGDTTATNEYTLYPAGEGLGIDTVLSKVKDLSPDMLFLFQDHFNIAQLLEQAEKENVKLPKKVTYFPVDGLPVSPFIKRAVTETDKLFIYTEWSRKALLSTFPNSKEVKNAEVLYHGVDTSVFKPLPFDTVMEVRNRFGWGKKFIAINVNRYQPRKQIPSTVRAFSMFAKGYNTCMSCNHKQTLNLKLCECCGSTDIKPTKTRKKDVALYLHMMPYDTNMGMIKATSLISVLYNAGFTDKDAPGLVALNGANILAGDVSEEDLNLLYNTANVNLSSTCGEGAGLSLIESQAVGVPSIAPQNSAIPEMLNNTGTIVPVKGFFNMGYDTSHMRPAVDEWEFRCALENHYSAWQQSGKIKEVKQNCLTSVKDKFNWDDKRAQLLKAFKELTPPTKQ